MNRKSAIKILRKQKAKLTDKNHYNDETWVFQTASYIKDFFGYNSTEYSFISKFSFTVKVLNITPPEETLQLIKEKEQKALNFLDDCVETISNKGLYKRDNIIFLKKLVNVKTIGLILSIGATIFLIGYYFGTEKINKENIELNREVKILRDSLNQGIVIENDFSTDKVLNTK
ncbi:MAG: hypothetical protein KAT68_16635 [Bacteroidales bacterium]|nr:hypothetical protein [Bacteroidales bacterium]